MKNLIFSLLALLFLECRDNSETSSDTLPPATQTGANTFGCRVNGIVFVPNKAIGSTVVEKPITFYGFYIGTQNHSNMLSGLRQSDLKNALYIDIYMYKFSINGTGDYLLEDAYYYDDSNQPFVSYIRCKAKSPLSGVWKVFGSYHNSGKITITRFDQNGCSGVFYGKLKEENGNETIDISDGRFDINYKTL